MGAFAYVRACLRACAACRRTGVRVCREVFFFGAGKLKVVQFEEGFLEWRIGLMLSTGYGAASRTVGKLRPPNLGSPCPKSGKPLPKIFAASVPT